LSVTGNSGSADREDGVILDDPLFTSLYFFTSLIVRIEAQYKWRRDEFLPPAEISQGEVEFPRVQDPPNGYHVVLISCGTYGFIRLRTLSGYFIAFFPFLLLTGFIQPRWSAPKEGDKVMARLHKTCPGPGNTHWIYSASHEP
jgi:hypothetical protein